MTSPDDPHAPTPEAQRRELEESERAAATEQPKSFRDEAMKDKVVEVAPIAEDDSAIKGLDPK